MNDLKPNSIEAVILFILYICIQDGRISEEESKELIITAPIIQKMYLHIFGEFIPFDLELIISDMLEKLIKEKALAAGKNVKKAEKDLFSKLLTDHATQDIALLASRSAAGADGLHPNENRKYQYWSEKWVD
tara:strand:- start:566 stop:961 length:396 start_codon:yes stop_codon:yes gene_type:complete